MTKEISVIGHRNPDTDCTLSAIIMAEYLSMKGYIATPYILGQLNKETLYLLEKYGISQPKIQTILEVGIPVCLVDHNESSQSIENFKELDIHFIVDHHKIDFASQSPLHMRVEPLCSTASIIYKMYIESGFEVSKQTATLMLACIMSDSLLWKSPTTTIEDQEIAQKLQGISEVFNLEPFATPMFEAKSDLGDMAILDVIQYDYKIFEFGNKKIGVGTLETTNPGYALGRKNEILGGLKELKKTQKLDFIMLSIVDILGEKNLTIVCDGYDTEVIIQVFNTSVHENIADLGSRLSRKKQIIPELTDFFNS